MDKKTIDQLWRHMHCLVVLAEQGSFTAAARRLAISKSAVSQQIAELEQAIGVPLVRRTTRSMRLTDAGQLLVEEVRTPYRHIASGFAAVRDLSDAPSGLVRLTAPVALARQHLIPRLPEFTRLYPRIRLDLDLSDDLLSLASDGFDCALRHVDTPPDTYVAKAVARTRTVLVASPAYLAVHAPITHPSHLSEHRNLLYPRQRGSGTWAFEYIGPQPPARRHVSVQVHPDFVANNSEVLREMACSGAGVALLPDFSAQSGILRGDLVEVLPAWRPVGTFGRRIYLLRPYSSQVSRAVRALWGHLTGVFPNRFEIPRTRAAAADPRFDAREGNQPFP